MNFIAIIWRCLRKKPFPPEWIVEDEAQLEDLRRLCKAMDTFAVVFWVLYSTGVFIALGFLLVGVKTSSLPPGLRNLWNGPLLIPILYIPSAIFIHLSKLGKLTQAMKPYGNALLDWDRAKKAFQRWEKSHRRGDLEKAVLCMKRAQGILGPAPSFQAFRKEVERAIEGG
jgi:hypothetical protein